MPDSRTARGPHPKDSDCFATSALPALRCAVAELSWLLDRQRMAVQRCAASQEDRVARWSRTVPASELAGETLAVDGYNILLTVEAALSGGVLLLGSDGVVRDLTSMSGHYRRMRSTRPALEAIAAFAAAHSCRELLWLFDRPISNSGRLKQSIDELATA